jgi:hypothetical protein
MELATLELNAADYSLISWIQRAEIPIHSLSIQFHPHCLMVQCQTLEAAIKLWETRSSLHIPQKEVCFCVNGTFYIGATT